MKRAVIAAGVALTIASAASLWPPSSMAQPPGQPTAWEYKILTMHLLKPAAEQEGELNMLGAVGWELVASSQSDRTVRYCLKRPKPR